VTRESDDARRENQRSHGGGCEELLPDGRACGGHVWLGSGYLPHDPECPKRQRQEAEALRHLGAGFPVSPGWPQHGPVSFDDPHGYEHQRSVIYEHGPKSRRRG